MNSLNNERFQRNQNKEMVKTHVPKNHLRQPGQGTALKDVLQSYYQFHLKNSKRI